MTVVEALEAAESRVVEKLAGQPDVELATLNIIAMTYLGLGAVKEAGTVAERALTRARMLHDDNSAEVATARLALAQVYLQTGEPARAETLLRASLPVFRKTGEDWRNLAGNLHDLGVVLNRMGRGEEAEKLYHEAIDIYRAHHAPELAEPLAMALNDLAVTIGMRGDYGEAKSFLIELYTAWDKPEQALAFSE